MRGSYRRVEHTVRTIRYEMEAPVEAKEIGIALSWVQQEFQRLNGRPVECDNDYWLEPMDEAVAFVFRVEERVTDDASVGPVCSTCLGDGEIRCAAHQAGDGCENGTLPCPDCKPAPTAPIRSCPNCHSPVQVILGPFDDQRCTDTWHDAVAGRAATPEAARPATD